MKELNQGNPNGCQSQNDKHQWHEILPLQFQYLVNTKTRECPANPHQDPHNSKRLYKEPDDARNEIHHGIETVKTGYMQRHPAS